MTIRSFPGGFPGQHGWLSHQTCSRLDYRGAVELGEGEESVQSQLRVTRRNRDAYGQVSRGLCKKHYDQDMQQCRAKIKELRQAYHKLQEANYRSSGAPKTCHFYKELNAILDGDPTSIADSPVDTSEAAERGENPEAEILDEEFELEEDVELPAGSLDGARSQELFSTPEVLKGEQEADEALGYAKPHNLEEFSESMHQNACQLNDNDLPITREPGDILQGTSL
ncbi:hypothetical protein UY3_04394 [Chelonia mydas]|uniref:Myb/SANT-like DNA-binding domain-containing protein n=1 Tax=Chelonia mydas TaxID=8469 RepID=M7BRP9_CHEMY|nr:hypothetical protein UY3_04394 [Chelonia mydas]